MEERAKGERLRRITQAMQRHRFGRAESLLEDPLLLDLEEAEQIEAAGHAERDGGTGRESRPHKRAAGEPR